MLTGVQQIVYRREDKVFSAINSDNERQLPQDLRDYVRHMQPLTKPGNNLSIPFFQGEGVRVWGTSPVESREVCGNTLIFKTPKSRYSIEYLGIDLEAVLAEHGGAVSDDFPVLVEQRGNSK